MDRVERLLELFERIQHLRLQPDAALVPLGDLTLSQIKALFYQTRSPLSCDKGPDTAGSKGRASVP